MSKKGEYIGFPEGRLREKPVRLSVLGNEEDWFAVNKFAGILPQAHPWYPDRPNLTSVIREQVAEGKGELQRLGISQSHYISGAECEFAGPTLFAKSKAAADFLKNAFGSNQFLFRFWFLTAKKTELPEQECTLPVGPHKSEPRLVVTHRYGKKATTRFTRLIQRDNLSLWEATTTHPRLHQIRLHAAELELGILGDSLYGVPEVADFARKDQKRNRLFNHRFSGLAAVLRCLDLSAVIGKEWVLEAPLPKPFLSLLRKCGIEGVE